MIKIDKIRLDVWVYETELKEYGKKGLKILLKDIIDRYFHSEYYDPDLIQEIKELKS